MSEKVKVDPSKWIKVGLIAVALEEEGINLLQVSFKSGKMGIETDDDTRAVSVLQKEMGMNCKGEVYV